MKYSRILCIGFLVIHFATVASAQTQEDAKNFLTESLELDSVSCATFETSTQYGKMSGPTSPDAAWFMRFDPKQIDLNSLRSESFILSFRCITLNCVANQDFVNDTNPRLNSSNWRYQVSKKDSRLYDGPSERKNEGTIKLKLYVDKTRIEKALSFYIKSCGGSAAQPKF